jgi:hydrogenase expression/formation protein HypC
VCLAIPGQIVECSPDDPLFAKVEVAGVRRTINVGLIADPGIQPGDWVLIHVGFAMSRIEEEQAREQLELLRMLGEEMPAMEEVRGYAFSDPPEMPA